MRGKIETGKISLAAESLARKFAVFVHFELLNSKNGANQEIDDLGHPTMETNHYVHFCCVRVRVGASAVLCVHRTSFVASSVLFESLALKTNTQPTPLFFCHPV